VIDVRGLTRRLQARVVLVVLAIVTGYFVFRTGDLGAKAVWQGRIQATHAGDPGGPGEHAPAPPSGGPYRGRAGRL
jgi:hypothetical protein